MARALLLRELMSLLILMLLVCGGLAADPLNRDSPQSTVVAFLQAYHSKDYQRASRYLDLRRLPSNQRLKQGVELAEQLGQILDRDTLFDEAALSQNPDVAPPQTVASFNVDKKSVELQLERVNLRRDVSVWLFSSDGVELIPRIAKAGSDSPLQRYMPDPLVNWKLLDTPVWRWLALALLAAILVALSRVVCRLTLAWAMPAMKRLAPRINSFPIDAFMGPLRLLLVALGFRAGMEWIEPSPQLARFLERAVALVFFWALAWLAMRVVDMAMVHVRSTLQSKHRTFAHSVLPLTTRVIKIVIAVLAVVTVLSNWGYNTTTILAGLGVGGVAIALAAQKTIENLFGGIAVISDRPVVVGDLCKFGDRSGTVEDIGLRSTRIRTADRTLVTVPNGAFSMMTLENFSRKDKTWFHLMLNLRRDTTPDQMRGLLRSLTQILQQSPKVEVGNRPVRFVGVGTYSLDLDINAYFSTTDDDELAAIQEELYLAILDAVEAQGTALALPTQAFYAIGNGSRTRESLGRSDAKPAR
jgi:MscS family membrane protein